ncbi:hypothetical protein NQ420_27750, partial [Escherichia coli]|nr:hypothetical protein [Escherichia coli]
RRNLQMLRGRLAAIVGKPRHWHAIPLHLANDTLDTVEVLRRRRSERLRYRLAEVRRLDEWTRW